jgi:hypothetical protein
MTSNHAPMEKFMEPKFTKGLYTACFQSYYGEVTGFHITAQPHGGTRPLVRIDDAWDKGARTFADGELEANGYLFAAAAMQEEALTRIYSATQSVLNGEENVIEAMQDIQKMVLAGLLNHPMDWPFKRADLALVRTGTTPGKAA